MKYKYYFKKPKLEIAKDILQWLAISGAITIAATSPYFGINLAKGLKWDKRRKYQKQKLINAFQRLQKNGCLDVQKKNHQIYIGLTEKGRKIAGWFQIDSLKIKRPRKWDGKWRIVIFDIPHLKKFYREAFRGKLKELGFYPLQKSVWIFPFSCQDEIELLRKFFGLTQKEMRLIVSEDIGPSDWLKKIFKI